MTEEGKMNKYIEIMRDELTNIIRSESYPDDLSEEAVVSICDIVFEALGYINVSFFDIKEYEEFIDVLSKYEFGQNPSSIRMIGKIKEHHQSLIKECEEDPEYRRFDSFTEDQMV
jgi:hypothetical protein